MKKDIQNEVCTKFCSYYKPDKEDELACKGFLVIEGLIRKGSQIPSFTQKKRLGMETVKILIQNMCVVCPFYEDGCDFVVQPEKCPPCGGFIVAGHLLEANIITIDNIKDVG